MLQQALSKHRSHPSIALFLYLCHFRAVIQLPFTSILQLNSFKYWSLLHSPKLIWGCSSLLKEMQKPNFLCWNTEITPTKKSPQKAHPQFSQNIKWIQNVLNSQLHNFKKPQRTYTLRRSILSQILGYELPGIEHQHTPCARICVFEWNQHPAFLYLLCHFP